jgi:type I restriction enzyme M protein
LEKSLWEAADKLRKNIDAAQYKHVVLGLIFLRHMSDAFEKFRNAIIDGQGVPPGTDPEDREIYRQHDIFFMPPLARWTRIATMARDPKIGSIIDEAMELIEAENPSLTGVLSKIYDRQHLDPACLGGLVALVGNISLGDAQNRSADLLGHVFEYFLGQFALGEGKKGGQFYTPRSIVELLVEMIEPFKGNVYDPCCGSGGMFVQSEAFVASRNHKRSDLKVFGQESNQTTWRLARMNLAIQGIDSTNVIWNSEGSFLSDAHSTLVADYTLANPPFNDSDWSGDRLRFDERWRFGIPPAANANFAWLSHIIHHMAPNGHAGIVLAKGTLTSKSGNEGDIRRRMITEGNIVDCIVNLPPKLFLNTQIPAAMWILAKNRRDPLYRDRRNEILFIDARDCGDLITRRTRVFLHNDIELIAGTYHEWRNHGGQYQDVRGFCRSASFENIRQLDYVLTPGRYVGLADDETEFDFKDRFLTLRDELKSQLEREENLNALILESLDRIRF